MGQLQTKYAEVVEAYAICAKQNADWAVWARKGK